MFLLIAHGLVGYDEYGFPYYTVSTVYSVDGGIIEAQEEAERLARAIVHGCRVDIQRIDNVDSDLRGIPYGCITA